MKCPVCSKRLNNENALCCPECKEQLKGMMQNLESMCESEDEEAVFLAYSTMKDWSLINHIESLYEDEQSYSILFPTIKQQNNFISQAYEEHNERPEDWINDLEFYKKVSYPEKSRHIVKQ